MILVVFLLYDVIGQNIKELKQKNAITILTIRPWPVSLFVTIFECFAACYTLYTE